VSFTWVAVLGLAPEGGLSLAWTRGGAAAVEDAAGIEAVVSRLEALAGGRGLVGVEQGLLDDALIEALRAAFKDRLALWPAGPWEGAGIVVAAVEPGIFEAEARAGAERSGGRIERARLEVFASALWRLAESGGIEPLLQAEGDVFGAGSETLLRAAVPSELVPPRLKNDCFAMPQGVDWVPVEEALARLKAALHPVTTLERLPVAEAAGRVLAEDCRAARSNPPAANSAVDGYGFAHAATGSGPQRLPLVEGRAAAGQPFAGRLPEGAAVRVLTGAILPEGVDTVVLEEDTATDGAAVVFDGPIRRGANTRRAGEDVAAGDVALGRGQVLRPPDLALLAALGLAEVPVYRRLRVGVLSTGDEIVTAPGAGIGPHQIFDANRPMLLATAARWGYEPVDLGHVRDDEAEIASRLTDGAGRADVILTSGGASAGDEDHVSRVLRERGTLSSWRIAIKPGRPLALALWQGVPVFGLPGNPVAAFVCALIFARPALAAMAGAPWSEPLGFTVPAAFSKSKKPGRREYLRARLDAEGRAEVFASEGSGRISGLSWAMGLVELPDGTEEIAPGAPVRFLPYSGFGL
jgi:molybdopterin molybdotransferase